MGSKSNATTNRSGFTIVELLVVIVVIAILAVIVVVTYSGVSKQAVVSSLQSDLTNAAKQLNLFSTSNDSFPATIDCSTPNSTTNKCIKPSSGNILAYLPESNDFNLIATNGDNCYSITSRTAPAVGCVKIGNQHWMKTNLNLGTFKTVVSGAMSSNGQIEKYCYGDIEANCNLYGGLYQWDEAMGYGVKDICPAGFHIPSDGELKTTEIALNMTQTEADSGAWGRGTDQGKQLRWGGSSGYNAPYGGYWDRDFGWQYGTFRANYWTSTGSFTTATTRTWMSTFDQSYRSTSSFKANALSIRCVKN
ncbi:prepilin-type N-terminal cleavage/methylation domain-containing protein [Candidatus Saccharibacteria bacterium]|nr:prepilin-type N-terminal cleavage/methylation domain-containing protein [Candidatus Saccharibacteria bacterium]